MQTHTIAALVPPMSEEEYQVLKADIEAHGLLEPITLFEGKVLDGRHRLRACEELGVEPRLRDLPEGLDPLEFVLSENLHRRHLSSDQRAAVAVEAEAFRREREAARERQVALAGTRPNMVPDLPQSFGEGSTKHERESSHRIAKIVGTNRQYVSDAQRLKERAPEVFKSLKAGRVSIPLARRIERLPAELRERALEEASAAGPREAHDIVRKMAREVRRQEAAVEPRRSDRIGTASVADIRSLEVEPESVDLIFTDPRLHGTPTPGARPAGRLDHQAAGGMGLRLPRRLTRRVPRQRKEAYIGEADAAVNWGRGGEPGWTRNPVWTRPARVGPARRTATAAEKASRVRAVRARRTASAVAPRRAEEQGAGRRPRPLGSAAGEETVCPASPPAGRDATAWPRCSFPSPRGPIVKTGLAALFHPPVVRSSLRTALVVGTILVLINHAGALIAGRLTPALGAEMLLTYLVPYAVSTYGAVAVSSVTDRGDERGDSGP